MRKTNPAEAAADRPRKERREAEGTRKSLAMFHPVRAILPQPLAFGLYFVFRGLRQA